MNKYNFILKFIANKEGNGKFKFNLFFPFIGIIMGCMTVALTLSVMEGMEYAIFTKLENISFPGKLTNVYSTNSNELNNYLVKNNISFQQGVEGQIILMKGSDFRHVTIHGIDKFSNFKHTAFGSDVAQIENHNNSDNLYIGKPLAIKLDLVLRDTVWVIHPGRINIFTGLPARKKMIVGGIFNLNVLDYDHKHIFCQYNALNNFLPDEQRLLYLEATLKHNQFLSIKEQFPKLHYQFWEENHSSFIAAMKLEKFTYTMIGFLIVAVAGFTMMSMMSLSVMQKVPQIGILRAIGMHANDIGYMFILQSIITSIVSSLIGILLSLFVIQIDNQYNLLHIFFPKGYYFDFPLILSHYYIMLIIITTLILIIVAGLYPSIKAARLDPIQSIGFKR